MTACTPSGTCAASSIAYGPSFATEPYLWPMTSRGTAHSANCGGKVRHSGAWSRTGKSRRSTAGPHPWCSGSRSNNWSASQHATPFGLRLSASQLSPAHLLIPWPSHPLVRDLLSGLDAGLVEGVDAVEGSGDGCLHFERLDEITEVLFVWLAESYGAVGAPGFGEGPPGSIALHVQELCHGVSPEVSDAFEVCVGFRHLQVARVVFDLHYLDHLVLRTLHVELDL